ncbi:hypothetical protein, partial [Kibdelosporangium philippinense]
MATEGSRSDVDSDVVTLVSDHYDDLDTETLIDFDPNEDQTSLGEYRGDQFGVTAPKVEVVAADRNTDVNSAKTEQSQQTATTT